MNFKARLKIPNVGIVYVEHPRGIYLIAPESGATDPEIIDMLVDTYRCKRGHHVCLYDMIAFLEHTFALNRGSIQTLWKEELPEEPLPPGSIS